MKLVIIGGAGVRSPLIMPALVRRQDALGLTQVVLEDTNEEKLGLMAPLGRYSADRLGAHFRIDATTDAREALPGANGVITTIRVGAEAGRVLDERIALRHGVLGQETTGPGGFAMALRTVPIVAGYAGLMQEVCPDAWLLNFTNPAGLVAQAVTEQFPGMKIAGICDTPTGLHRDVAHLFGRKTEQVPVQLFGLNHLSWMTEALVDGENVVPEVIRRPEWRARVEDLAYFEPGLLELLGVLPNEYLYYYYYREQALAHIQAAGETRGEQVQRLSASLLHDLKEIGPAQHPERAWQRYRAYLDERHGSYMAMETGSSRREAKEAPPGEEGEGYAGVALDILAAQGTPARVIANVPNRGAIPGLRNDDVVEIVCEAGPAGLEPVPVKEVPEDEFSLLLRVKQYERRTVDAIREKSRAAAVEALMDHPLVGSYPVSKDLVDEYLEAHAAYVGEWT